MYINARRIPRLLSTFSNNIVISMLNTPGTAVGPVGRDRTLAIKRRKNARGNKFSSSGVSPKWVEKQKRKKEEERKLVITMASYALQTSPQVAHASRLFPSLLWPFTFVFNLLFTRDGKLLSTVLQVSAPDGKLLPDGSTLFTSYFWNM